jgi:hypothetical protein
MSEEDLKQDAHEMMQILTSALCMKRHMAISHDRLAEILTALVTKGALTKANKEGHDVLSPSFGLVEVKSRVLGTDGPYPRVSLRPSNVEHAQYFMAVRWTRGMELYDAVGVPKRSVEVLYKAKLQASGRVAHIGWKEWLVASGARSFANDMRMFLPRLNSPQAA